MQKQSFLSSLVSSTFWKIVGYVASFVKHVIIAAAIGLSTQLDVFYMAMAFVGIMVTTWASALEFVAMPQLVRAESVGNQERFRKLAGTIFITALGASFLVSSFAVVFRDSLTALALGFDTSRRSALAAGFIWLVPVLMLSVPLGVFSAVLRAKRLFSISYQADALLALVLLFCIVITPNNPSVLLWSMSLGVFSAFIYTGTFAMKHIQILNNPIDNNFGKLFRTVPALMLLYGTFSIFAILDRVFASYLSEGSISALAYALMLVLVIPSLLGIKSSFLTVAAEKTSKSKRTEIFNDLISLIIFISTGTTAFMLLAGDEIIEFLFERGAFGVKDTIAVTSALVAFSLIVTPTLLLKPLDQIFQIENKIGIMVRRTFFGIVVGALLNYLAVFVLGLGTFGIALATTVSFWTIAMLGIYSFLKIGYELDIARHLRWAGWCILHVIVGGVIIYPLPDFGSFINIISAAAIISFAVLLASKLYPSSREAELVKHASRRLRNFWT